VSQIRTDTDEWRTSYYPQIECNVSDQCDLSESTLQLLRNTFADVKIAQGWVD